MPRTCTVCGSSHRAKIEQALVAGNPVLTIARKYRVSRDAITRHRAKCVAQVIQRKADKLGDRIVEEVEELHAIVRNVIDEAQTAKDGRTALQGVAEGRKNLELLARLSGKFDTRPEGERPMLTWEEFLVVYRRAGQ
jgi:hypothetical protein